MKRSGVYTVLAAGLGLSCVLAAVGPAAGLGNNAPAAAGCCGGAEIGRPAAPAAPDRPTLETIKKLAGEWVQVGDDGKPTSTVISSMRVTAAGSAVVETVMPGTDHEMLTVYHMNGERLELTHYCVKGNQPRMRAQDESTAGRLVFKCYGATNVKSEDDAHMHEAVVQIADDDHIKSSGG
jgi:hypothetical protein